MSSRLPPACDALDFGAHQALNHAWKVFVEPSLEHRAQHFADQILQRASILHQYGLSQRVEGRIDRGAGLAREQLRQWIANSRATKPFQRSSSKPISELPSIVRNCAADGMLPLWAGLARFCRRHRFGQFKNIRCGLVAAAIHWRDRRRLRGRRWWRRWRGIKGIGFDQRPGAPRDCVVASQAPPARLAAQASGAGCGDLVVSSSAMMRRMEARISSIDGSCAFAGWVIPAPRCLIPLPIGLGPPVPCGATTQTAHPLRPHWLGLAYTRTGSRISRDYYAVSLLDWRYRFSLVF